MDRPVELSACEFLALAGKGWRRPSGVCLERRHFAANNAVKTWGYQPANKQTVIYADHAALRHIKTQRDHSQDRSPGLTGSFVATLTSDTNLVPQPSHVIGV